MSAIDISVIIPVFNTSAYLREAVGSILNQTLKSIEIIAVNDGSSDNSLEILNELTISDDRLRVISYDQNQGVSVCRNTGFEQAQGKYIYFFDSDDILEPDCLELCYRKMESDNYDFLIFDGVSFLDNQKKTGFNATYQRTSLLTKDSYKGSELTVLLHQKKSYSCSICLCFIRKNYLEKLGLQFYPGVLYEDVLYTILLYLSAHSITFVKRDFFRRRVRPNSTMTTAVSQRLINYRYIIGNELISQKKSFADRESLSMLNYELRHLFIFLVKTLLRSRQLLLLVKNSPRILKMIINSYF